MLLLFVLFSLSSQKTENVLNSFSNCSFDEDSTPTTNPIKGVDYWKADSTADPCFWGVELVRESVIDKIEIKFDFPPKKMRIFFSSDDKFYFPVLIKEYSPDSKKLVQEENDTLVFPPMQKTKFIRLYFTQKKPVLLLSFKVNREEPNVWIVKYIQAETPLGYKCVSEVKGRLMVNDCEQCIKDKEVNCDFSLISKKGNSTFLTKGNKIFSVGEALLKGAITLKQALKLSSNDILYTLLNKREENKSLLEGEKLKLPRGQSTLSLKLKQSKLIDNLSLHFENAPLSVSVKFIFNRIEVYDCTHTVKNLRIYCDQIREKADTVNIQVVNEIETNLLNTKINVEGYFIDKSPDSNFVLVKMNKKNQENTAEKFIEKMEFKANKYEFIQFEKEKQGLFKSKWEPFQKIMKTLSKDESIKPDFLPSLAKYASLVEYHAKTNINLEIVNPIVRSLAKYIEFTKSLQNQEITSKILKLVEEGKCFFNSMKTHTELLGFYQEFKRNLTSLVQFTKLEELHPVKKKTKRLRLELDQDKYFLSEEWVVYRVIPHLLFETCRQIDNFFAFRYELEVILVQNKDLVVLKRDEESELQVVREANRIYLVDRRRKTLVVETNGKSLILKITVNQGEVKINYSYLEGELPPLSNESFQRMQQYNNMYNRGKSFSIGEYTPTSKIVLCGNVRLISKRFIESKLIDKTQTALKPVKQRTEGNLKGRGASIGKTVENQSKIKLVLDFSSMKTGRIVILFPKTSFFLHFTVFKEQLFIKLRDSQDQTIFGFKGKLQHNRGKVEINYEHGLSIMSERKKMNVTDQYEGPLRLIIPSKYDEMVLSAEVRLLKLAACNLVLKNTHLIKRRNDLVKQCNGCCGGAKECFEECIDLAVANNLYK